MMLRTPNNCGECFFAKQMFDILVCTNPAVSEDWKTQDIRSLEIESDEIPEWCPYILTNKCLEAMSEEKQEAVANMMDGLRVLLGWNEVSGDG